MFKRGSSFLLAATLLVTPFIATAEVDDYATKEKTPGVSDCVAQFQGAAEITNRNHLITNMCYCMIDQEHNHGKKDFSSAAAYCSQEAVLENSIYKVGAANQSKEEDIAATCKATSDQALDLMVQILSKANKPVSDSVVSEAKKQGGDTCKCQAPYLLDIVTNKLTGDALEAKMKLARSCSAYGADADSVSK
jgi:hypothetical protein